MSQYSEKLLDGSMRLESDSELLLAAYSRDKELTYVAAAEIGELGLEFSRPYKGLQINVDAVLNQEEEDWRIHRAFTLCAPRTSCTRACWLQSVAWGVWMAAVFVYSCVHGCDQCEDSVMLFIIFENRS
jgi:hypothetical protein